jgi:hypothetical protein
MSVIKQNPLRAGRQFVVGGLAAVNALVVNALLVGALTLGAASGAFAQSAAELRALENELDTLSERIERLQDLSEVEIVQRAYGYYVDKSLWYDLADLWTEDGTLEIGGRGVFLGKERVFEYMSVGLGPVGPRRNLLVDHQQFQPIVTINPDGKTAELRAIAFVMSNGGWGHNYYENDYVKEDGVWKMAALHGPFNMYSGYDIGWLDNTTLNTFPEKFAPPPDLPPTVIYLTFPNYYVEPFHYPNPVTGAPMPPPDRAAGGAAFGRYRE